MKYQLSRLGRPLSRAGVLFGTAVMAVAMVVAFLPGKANAAPLDPMDCNDSSFRCTIKSASSSYATGFLCMDNDGAGYNSAAIVLRNCDESGIVTETQRFRFVRTVQSIASGQFAGESAYVIQNADSNKCLNVQGGSKDDGAKIIQYTCMALLSPAQYAPNEQFIMRADGDQVKLLARHSGKCVFAKRYNGEVVSGSQLKQQTCSWLGGVTDQLWEYQTIFL